MAFMFLFLLIVPFAVSAEEPSERVIITFKGEIDQKLLEENALEIHHIFEEYHAVSVTIPAALKNELAEHPGIALIERDSVVKTNAQKLSWGYDQLSIAESSGPNYGLTGKGVKIGIIDTGIDLDHPDLRVAGGVSLLPGVTSFDDDSIEGHGTAIAGIIAALDNEFGTVGVAPDAEIYAIKTLDSAGAGNITDVVAGINWAIANNMDIINLSLTSPVSKSILETAIQTAYNKGVLIVAASGNILKPQEYISDVLYPARYPQVIAVGSVGKVDSAGRVTDLLTRSQFSYFGSNLDFVAPGAEIWSTFNGSKAETQYIYTIGTSMAAPFVTGIAALYKEQYPQLKSQQIRGHMERAAYDLGAAGKDAEYGYGLIQPPSREKADLFIDLKESAWYSDEILYLYRKGIVSGYSDGGFHPNQPVTRAEAVAMLGRAKGFDGTKTLTKFTDVSASSFASGYVKSATDYGVINGYNDGTFRPGNNIIRGDVAVILNNAFKFTKVNKAYFNDVPSSKHYYNAINSMASEKITSGFSDGGFRPDQYITRVEFAVFLAKALEDDFK
jgi:hypothetical protein